MCHRNRNDDDVTTVESNWFGLHSFPSQTCLQSRTAISSWQNTVTGFLICPCLPVRPASPEAWLGSILIMIHLFPPVAICRFWPGCISGLVPWDPVPMWQFQLWMDSSAECPADNIQGPWVCERNDEMTEWKMRDGSLQTHVFIFTYVFGLCGQTDRKIGKYADRETDRWLVRQVDRLTDRSNEMPHTKASFTHCIHFAVIQGWFSADTGMVAPL